MRNEKSNPAGIFRVGSGGISPFRLGYRADSSEEPRKMQALKREPSAVVWAWREGETGKQGQAHDASGVRLRGAIGAAIGLAVAAALWRLGDRPKMAAVVAVVALLLALPTVLAPRTAGRAVARALDRFAHAVGSGVTWVLMTLIFYVLFLPLGLLLRSRKRLGITRAFDPRLDSYWTVHDRAQTPDSYRKQF
jgi:hypothetical protein